MEHFSTIHVPRPAAHAGYAVIEALAAATATAAQALWRWIAEAARSHRMAAARREMLAMSDHCLRDIGLTRGQVDQLFR